MMFTTRPDIKNEKNPRPSVSMLGSQKEGCGNVSKFAVFSHVKIATTLNPGGRGFVGLFSRGVYSSGRAFDTNLTHELRVTKVSLASAGERLSSRCLCSTMSHSK